MVMHVIGASKVICLIVQLSNRFARPEDAFWLLKIGFSLKSPIRVRNHAKYSFINLKEHKVFALCAQFKLVQHHQIGIYNDICY
jgi:hypothetical protein